jgi:hypothetical protein
VAFLFGIVGVFVLYSEHSHLFIGRSLDYSGQFVYDLVLTDLAMIWQFIMIWLFVYALLLLISLDIFLSDFICIKDLCFIEVFGHLNRVYMLTRCVLFFS